MTTGYWLKTATRFLQSRSISTARLDAIVLLEDVLKIDRATLLAEPTTEMKDSQVAYLQNLLIRRSQHEPLAYIVGRSEFYGRTFVITPAVLQPRPESETMISLLKELYLSCLLEPVSQHGEQNSGHHRNENDKFLQRDPEGSRPDGKVNQSDSLRANQVSIADVGSGSGALGITAALELPNAAVDLLEIDPAAAKVSQINVDLFTLSISVIDSDLLSNTDRSYDVLLCNLPYVPDDYTINTAALHEPRLAIFGGPDGLDVYRALFSQLAGRSAKPLYILTESLPPQHTTLAEIAANQGYSCQKTDDFIQLFKRHSLQEQ